MLSGNKLTRATAKFLTRYFWEKIRPLEQFPSAYRRRFSNVQAILGIRALHKLDEFNERSQSHADVYTRGLADCAGLLDWRLTILAAAIGGSAGDQIYFYAAHERAARAIKKSKRLSKWYPKISKFVLRHSTIAVLLSRFAAGLRITIPLVCATAGMPAKKYSVLNLVSGFAWASFWVAITYRIGVHLSMS